MQKESFSRSWLFKRNEDPDFVTVDLPHDYSVTMPRSASAAGGPGNGFFPSCEGTYIKYFVPDEQAKHYLLDVDGAYMCTSVILNEVPLTMHPHGYTPFLVDLTEEIRPGVHNKLTISTNALQPSTRWYSGAGLYREVALWTGGSIRLEPWDIFVTTREATEKEAVVQAAYDISSDEDARIILRGEILNGDGLCVASTQAFVSVQKEAKTHAELEIQVKEPKLWDTENPTLYTMHTTLLRGEADKEVLDTDDTVFGIRTISVDSVNGFRLNGRPLKMRGGCIHHDHGVLGAADYPAAVFRKISLLKKAGFNAIRSAHNPPSLGLLEVCDRLGILLMDEAFDMWTVPKRSHDYHLWFRDWWARDIASMVRRDRNHPCVISYSIGNEIKESKGTMNGHVWAEKLAEEIRRYDTTRPVTSAVYGVGAKWEETDPEDYRQDFTKRFLNLNEDNVDDSWLQRTEKYFAPLDMAGYNYLYHRYADDHKKYPDRVIWGSETVVLNFYDSWHAVLDNDHVIGDFTWTAYDNLGEAGAGRFIWARDGYISRISLAGYPWRTCYQGDFDICGYRRPQSYFREAVWLGNTEPRIFTTHPEHYKEGFSGTGWHWHDVSDTWTFEERYLGKPVTCEVYTDADEIQWFLNGRELGWSKPEKAIAYFDIPYERGTVSVIAYKGGKECGRSALHTTEAPAAVTVVAQSTSFQADNRDLCYFDITVTDDKGNRVVSAKNGLTCIVDGGELLGIFSGDPANEDQYGSNRCHAFEGRALAIVRTGNPGLVTVTVGSAGLTSGRAVVTALS
ncbi:MAG: DUF4982 domain-containing protein [Lachnospiraceae bacterium]|nr:DUF4982 domain-containing protein [Lachnospiraceae bacterium]